MARTKYVIKKSRVRAYGSVDSPILRKQNHPAKIVDFENFSSDDLLDAFSAITAIEKGTLHPSLTSKKVSYVAQRYRHSMPATRKQMLSKISRTIVERNSNENPATPEAIAKMKKTFG